MLKKERHGRGFFSFLSKRAKLWVLIGIGTIGILLLIVGAAGSSKSSKVSDDSLGTRAAELDTYKKALEKEIETLCESVVGVSDCTVMVTLANGYKVGYTTEENGAPATVGSGSSEEALFDSLSPPTVAGVGIVCRGGRDAQVQQLLTELVSTALGISSARVFVTGK
ncbi:MAG: hypothetical protein IJC99_01820 [Clostridia bacterium]|nr:hypothetical protein [Clostridia bacterium]